MKIKCLLLTALLFAVTAHVCFAQAKKPAAKTTVITPDRLVKNLYAEHNAGKGPFNQNKSRAAIDKYFLNQPGSAVSVLGDVIWKIESDKNSTGFDFDPLYYSQDKEITGFAVGRPDENNMVTVKFKNFGKDEEVMFSFLDKGNAGSKVWKIDSISYSDSENLADLLEYGMMTETERAAAEKENKFDGDYLVGAVKCNIEQNRGGYWARVKCDDQANIQIIDTESLTFGLWKKSEKGRRGNFVRAADGSVGEYVDASGRKIKVTRVKTSDAAPASDSENESVFGELRTGKTESLILYVGMETGDYAAYCFKNNSEAGRAILAACKSGERCEVRATLGDAETECKVPGLEASLSASFNVVKVASAKSLGRRK